MKLIAFTIALITSFSSWVHGCGYYPYNEDVRYSILDTRKFGYIDYSSFYYTANYFGQPEVIQNINEGKFETSLKENLELWQKSTNNSVSIKDIYEALYYEYKDNLKSDSKNSFINFLYQQKDYETIDYLIFIKKLDDLNSFLIDPWERREKINLPQRNSFIDYALSKIVSIKNKDLKLRYAFIAMRLSFYNGQRDQVKTIYQKFFSSRKNKNIIDYWALHFRTLVENNPLICNYYSALVFANAPDKRFQVQQQYVKKIPIEQTLKLAKNNEEKAAIWLLDGICNPAKAYKSLEQIYRLYPKSDGLSFLLLRELNKLEDWIYTPYYSYFEPSIVRYEAYYPDGLLQKRIAQDRAYALKLLTFCNSVKYKSIENKLVWQMAKAYLNLMTLNYSQSLVKINEIEKSIGIDNLIKSQLQLIKSICLTSQQSGPLSVVPEYAKPIILEQHKIENYKFIFAIGRELEYKGNTTEAALIFSKLNEVKSWQYFGDNPKSAIWKTKKRHETLYSDYYEDYFYYMDAQYSITQVKAVINDLENHKAATEFDTWKYSLIKNDMSRLYDLLGTKYIRINNLKLALKSFEKVNDTLWKSDHFGYKFYLDANPFYTNMYNEHKRTAADSIKYTKQTIVRELIKYINLANNKMEKKRDYYNFLVANCYFNMSHYGNSWMMRRYASRWCQRESGLIDDAEYYNCNLAKHYYLKAGSLTKSKKFAALCLRMAGRCEKYRLLVEYDKNGIYSWEVSDSIVFKKNKYYKQIKVQYPNYYGELISNCLSFETYFNSRNY